LTNCAFKPIAEQALRKNESIAPPWLNAALGVTQKLGAGT
jgi:hypothetical protein